MAKSTDREIRTIGVPHEVDGKQFKSREQLLSIEDSVYEDIFVPEPWGTWIRIRALTIAERDRWERLATGGLSEEDRRLFGGVKLNAGHVRSAVVQMCALNPDNNTRLFNVQDIPALSKKSSATVTFIFDKIIKLSKVAEEDVAEVEAQFEGNPSSAPSTNSQTNSESGT